MTTKPGYVLAVDLGSGGPKVALVAEHGQVVAHARGAIDTVQLADGGAEQDPHQWWSVVTRAVREVLAQGAAPVDDILAVSCTGQWSVTVPIDRAGQVLAPAVHWLDRRGARYVPEVTRGWPKFEGYGLWRLVHWLRLTAGLPTHSGADALAHILYLQHERPEVYRRTWKLLEPVDYLNYRLTGRAAASYVSVFPYMLADNRRLDRMDYAPRLLAWSGIAREKLPDLYPMTHVLGPLTEAAAAEWGLSTRTQVVMGTGDSHAAVLGSGAVGDGELHVCVGTSSWLTGHVPTRRMRITQYLTTMPAALGDRYLVVAEQGPAGKCLELLARGWLFADEPRSNAGASPIEALLAAAERVPPGSRGLVFLPWLNGSGPPAAVSTARGGFLNQSLEHTRAEAGRAVLEGVATNLSWLLEAVERFAGRRQESLPFVGGGARSPLWCQIMADAMQRPIRQVAEPSLTIVRGAALAGFLTLGRLQRDDLARRVPVSQVFHPQPESRAVYAELRRTLVAAHRALGPLWKRSAAQSDRPGPAR